VQPALVLVGNKCDLVAGENESKRVVSRADAEKLASVYRERQLCFLFPERPELVDAAYFETSNRTGENVKVLASNCDNSHHFVFCLLCLARQEVAMHLVNHFLDHILTSNSRLSKLGFNSLAAKRKRAFDAMLGQRRAENEAKVKKPEPNASRCIVC
jgi:hypothetical protein